VDRSSPSKLVDPLSSTTVPGKSCA
jgi:hypothetical protein